MKLKYCGLHSQEDVCMAAASSCHYLGFVFAESKRKVQVDVVANWIKKAKVHQQQTVALFVNENLQNIQQVMSIHSFDVIQLHGIETPCFANQLREETSAKVWKAIHHEEGSLDLMRSFNDCIDGYIVDCRSKRAWGGTGESFDWREVPRYLEEGQRQGVPVFIAGGVNPGNVSELASYKPDGIDVSSGIEIDGKKSAMQMSRLAKGVGRDYGIKTVPNSHGRFGDYGGQYVPETLMSAIEELEAGLDKAMNDATFKQELNEVLQEYAGRETPLTYAANVSERIGGAAIYLKREDLLHTGAHKLNNALGQALLAKRMGKTKLVAETGAGQHGVATATIAAKFGMECKVFMGVEDMERQQLNVFRMELLGAEVVPAESGSQTLKDATNEAIRYWVAHAEDTFYLIGSVVGPHPYPKMVRNFQRIIGDESKRQILDRTGKLPEKIVACVGGGSNAIGMFYPFLEEENVNLIGVEAAGLGTETNKHAATITNGKKGIIHGSLTYLLQDEAGQITEPYSISAGLDYPGVGPEHAYLADVNRVEYKAVTDHEALEAYQCLQKKKVSLQRSNLPMRLQKHTNKPRKCQRMKPFLFVYQAEAIKICIRCNPYLRRGTNERSLKQCIKSR